MDKRFRKKNNELNKRIRRLNEDIIVDFLWQGRFYAHSICKDVYRYEDGSGVLISHLIEFVDRKTGITKLVWCDEWDIRGAKLWLMMNNFIIDTCKVWEDGHDPYGEIADYSRGERDRILARWKRKEKYLGYNPYKHEYEWKEIIEQRTANKNSDQVST